MNKIIFIFTLFTIVGCSSTVIYSDGMQPDGTYKIVSGGNAIASYDDAKQETYNRAAALCPKGYDKKSEYLEHSGLKPWCTIIVKCKD